MWSLWFDVLVNLFAYQSNPVVQLSVFHFLNLHGWIHFKWLGLYFYEVPVFYHHACMYICKEQMSCPVQKNQLRNYTRIIQITFKLVFSLSIFCHLLLQVKSQLSLPLNAWVLETSYFLWHKLSNSSNQYFLWTHLELIIKPLTHIYVLYFSIHLKNSAPLCAVKLIVL